MSKRVRVWCFVAVAALLLTLTGCESTETTEEPSVDGQDADASELAGGCNSGYGAPADIGMEAFAVSDVSIENCMVTGCPSGEVCLLDPVLPGCRQDCTCNATTGLWDCTTVCDVPACVPRTSCFTDAECTEGAQWCEGGHCVECDNSGLYCDLAACAPGSSMPVRNGCTPCTCALDNDCLSDSDCTNPATCQAGPDCFDWCAAGDPSCCYGNTCVGGTATTCTTDADCLSGAEWCEGGVCVECDNSGLVCFLACDAGTELERRNGCSPCNCVATNACTSSADCQVGESCAAGGNCLAWCGVDDPSCCYGNTCVVTP